MIGFYRKRFSFLAGVAILCAGAVASASVEESVRPVARGASPAQGDEAGVEIPSVPVRPVARLTVANSVPDEIIIGEGDAVIASAFSRLAINRSARPVLRNDDMVILAMGKNNQRSNRGRGLCGLSGVEGEHVGYVPGRLAACGIKDAVKVTSVSGVALSTGAVMDCATAQALKTWVDKGAIPAFRRKSGGLIKLRVAAHYACRTRNNQPGAKISEHGKGKAIDISGFFLADGSEVTVLNGWNSRSYRKPLREVQAVACGPFGTVLGPESNRFHQDHFHFDTASYRSGPYCR